MGVLEIIKKGFGIANKNLKFFLVLFVFNVIGALARIPYLPATAEAARRISGPLVAIAIVMGLLGVLFLGGILGSLKEFIQTQKNKLSGIVSYGAKYYLRILGVLILTTLILIPFGILVALGLSVALTVKNVAAITISGALALIVAAIGIYLFFLLFMAPYILVADEIGPAAAIKKSVSFVRKSLLKVIGLFLVIVLISAVIGIILGLLGGIAIVVVKGPATLTGKAILGIVSSLLNSYINIFFSACFLLLYLGAKKEETA